MQLNKLSLPKEFYIRHLREIEGVSFSQREVEVLACLLGGRNYTGISRFLPIAPRTAETHVRNIMRKLDCPSKEAVINFLENSHAYPFIKEYYSHLLVFSAYERSLKAVPKLISGKMPTCLIVCWPGKEKDHLHSFLSYLTSHLRLVGISSLTETRLENSSISLIASESHNVDYVIYVLPEREPFQERESVQYALNQALSFENSIFLKLGDQNYTKLKQKQNNINYIDFSDTQEYYFSFFELLKKLFPHIDLEKITSEFKRRYELTQASSAAIILKTESATAKLKPKESIFFGKIIGIIKENGKPALGVSALLILIVIIGLLTFYTAVKKEDTVQEQLKEESPTVRSELVVPTENTRLDRYEILVEIGNKLKGKSIRSVALVGIGGAGKSILARLYALSQRFPVVWEINAETKENLQRSFEKLAYALVYTEEDKKALKEFQEIRNPQEREERILLFVKKKLKASPSWLLIYDNVEQFSDIQMYFPHDPTVWGIGKIIITTRNGTVRSNNYVMHTLPIGELTEDQKLTLFLKILNKEGKLYLTNSQKEEIRLFLKEIPSFPLDVSLAAGYIENTNIPFKEYLTYLQVGNKDIINNQKKISEEASDYKETRDTIVILSLKKLLNVDKDFRDLLLFISFLDPQGIPRDLLTCYKQDAVVDNFIYHGQKYSLITLNASSSSNSRPTLAMHRSTQQISLSYLTHTFKLDKSTQIQESFVDALETYLVDAINNEDFLKLNLLLTHYTKFLTHKNYFNDAMKGLIEGPLGYAYYFLGDYKKAKFFLKESSLKLKNSQSNYQRSLFRNLSYLGNIYLDLGNFTKAKEALEESLQYFKKYLPENKAEVTRILGWLGIVYSELRDYKKSHKLIEENLLLYNESYAKNNKTSPQALVYIGVSYKNLGNYEKARELLEQAIFTYKKASPENYLNIAWASIQLGDVYNGLGEYEKAKILLEQNLATYQKHFSKNQFNIAWVLAILGNVYRNLGSYAKARVLLKKSFVIYEDLIGHTNAKTAWILGNLGNVYKDLGNYTEAKSLLEQSLTIHKKCLTESHPKTLQILSSLGRVYLAEGNIEVAEKFIIEALTSFKKNNSPDIYITLEDLAELYRKKADLISKWDYRQSQDLKNHAIKYLTHALEVAKTYFSEGSPHIKRIKAKLKDL